MVELNGYQYEVLESFDSNGNLLPITEEEELQAAKALSAFLTDVKEWSDEDIARLKVNKNTFGLDAVAGDLYEAHYDLCYIGNWSEERFLDTFNLTKQQLGEILM